MHFSTISITFPDSTNTAAGYAWLRKVALLASGSLALDNLGSLRLLIDYQPVRNATKRRQGHHHPSLGVEKRVVDGIQFAWRVSSNRTQQSVIMSSREGQQVLPQLIREAPLPCQAKFLELAQEMIEGSDPPQGKPAGSLPERLLEGEADNEIGRFFKSACAQERSRRLQAALAIRCIEVGLK